MLGGFVLGEPLPKTLQGCDLRGKVVEDELWFVCLLFLCTYGSHKAKLTSLGQAAKGFDSFTKVKQLPSLTPCFLGAVKEACDMTSTLFFSDAVQVSSAAPCSQGDAHPAPRSTPPPAPA